MGRTRVRTETGVSTETAATFVTNELLSGFVSIALAADASTAFLRDARGELTDVLETGLESRLLEQIRCQLRDDAGTVREEWVFDVRYEGDHALVEFPVERVTEAVGSHEGCVVVVNPVVDGIDVFDPAAGGESLGSFGAGDVDVDVSRG